MEKEYKISLFFHALNIIGISFMIFLIYKLAVPLLISIKTKEIIIPIIMLIVWSLPVIANLLIPYKITITLDDYIVLRSYIRKKKIKISDISSIRYGKNKYLVIRYGNRKIRMMLMYESQKEFIEEISSINNKISIEDYHFF